MLLFYFSSYRCDKSSFLWRLKNASQFFFFFVHIFMVSLLFSRQEISILLSSVHFYFFGRKTPRYLTSSRLMCFSCMPDSVSSKFFKTFDLFILLNNIGTKHLIESVVINPGSAPSTMIFVFCEYNVFLSQVPVVFITLGFALDKNK